MYTTWTLYTNICVPCCCFSSSDCPLTVAEHLHGGGAGSMKPQTYEGDMEFRIRRTSVTPVTTLSAMESGHVRNCGGRCSQTHGDDEKGECVVSMHVLPIKGPAQVKFKVVEGIEPTLSMPMLVASGNRVVFRGEDVMLSTAGGEVAPVDVRWRRMAPEGADQQQYRVHTR